MSRDRCFGHQGIKSRIPCETAVFRHPLGKIPCKGPENSDECDLVESPEFEERAASQLSRCCARVARLLPLRFAYVLRRPCVGAEKYDGSWP